MFQGFVELGSTIIIMVQTRNASDVPLNADAAPRRHVYEDGVALTAVEGQGSQAHTGSVTGATNATPIVITSASHGLQTGARVTITGVLGNTAANTTASITRVSADTFSLDGVAGNGAYTSGGTWNVAGLYKHEIVASEGNGFESGKTYVCYSIWLISSANRAQADTFTVI
jgi:hypothetical protein